MLLTCGAAAAVLAVLPVCCPNRLGAVLAAACPNMGVAEGAVAVLLVSWLKAELELAAGGWGKTDEPEVTVPNTAISVAGLGATLETTLEVVGGLDVSGATGTALGTAGVVTAVCPGTGWVEAGDGGSVLTSRTPEVAGAASAEGAATLVVDATVPGLLTAGWARAGSFLTESEV